MSSRLERVVAVLGFILLAVLVGAPLPSMPQFPGTLVGGVTGILAAALLLLAFLYAVLKPVLMRTRVGRLLSPATGLRLHVWIGAIAAALTLVHSGLALRSPLGSGLVLLVGTSVISGAIGRFYLRRFAGEVTREEAELAFLRSKIARGRQIAGDTTGDIVEVIADLESSRDVLMIASRGFRLWIVIHIVSSVAASALVVIHVWSALRLGVRWWP